MKTKFLKVWYMVAGGFALVAILYYIIRFIVQSVDPDNITAAYQTLDIFGLVFLGISLLMLVAIIPIMKISEVKQAKLEEQKALEQERLAKYKKKK